MSVFRSVVKAMLILAVVFCGFSAGYFHLMLLDLAPPGHSRTEYNRDFWFVLALVSAIFLYLNNRMGRARQKRKIKLMAEYGGLAVWRDGGEVGPMDPAELGISKSLAEDINSWARKYDKRLNWESPSDSAPVPQKERAEFEAEGKALWQRLSRELPEYEVVYFSESEQRVVGKLKHGRAR